MLIIFIDLFGATFINCFLKNAYPWKKMCSVEFSKTKYESWIVDKMI